MGDDCRSKSSVPATSVATASITASTSATTVATATTAAALQSSATDNAQAETTVLKQMKRLAKSTIATTVSHTDTEAATSNEFKQSLSFSAVAVPSAGTVAPSTTSRTEIATEAATAVAAAKPATTSSVRRCLQFGDEPLTPADRERNLMALKDMLSKIADADAEKCCRRWNFDFITGRPLRGRYEWMAMEASETTSPAMDESTSREAMSSEASTRRSSSQTRSTPPNGDTMTCDINERTLGSSMDSSTLSGCGQMFEMPSGSVGTVEGGMVGAGQRAGQLKRRHEGEDANDDADADEGVINDNNSNDDGGGEAANVGAMDIEEDKILFGSGSFPVETAVESSDILEPESFRVSPGECLTEVSHFNGIESDILQPLDYNCNEKEKSQ